MVLLNLGGINPMWIQIHGVVSGSGGESPYEQDTAGGCLQDTTGFFDIDFTAVYSQDTAGGCPQDTTGFFDIEQDPFPPTLILNYNTKQTTTEEATDPLTVTWVGSADSVTPPSFPASNSAFDKSAYIPNSSSRITTSATAKLAIAPTTLFTISFWMYFESGTNMSPDKFLIDAGSLANPKNWVLAQNGSGIYMQFFNSGGGGLPTAAHGGLLSDSTWYFVSVTHDGNGNLYFGLDGTVYTDTMPATAHTSQPSKILTIGAREGGTIPASGLYIDNLIINVTKFTSEYSSNFTAPTAPL